MKSKHIRNAGYTVLLALLFLFGVSGCGISKTGSPTTEPPVEEERPFSVNMNTPFRVGDRVEVSTNVF